MYSIRRSCRSALQSSQTLCSFANGSRRAFSRSSACQRGALPVFLEPSNPELSAHLSTLNSKVLLPCHLTSEQRKLVYKRENIPKLESEPVEITLGDVTLTLEHIDRNKDQPSRWQQFQKIVAKSETREDWENVVRVMEGYENAGIRMGAKWQERIVRKLSEAGYHHLILKALQRASATGLRLRNPTVLREVLRAVHDKAALADWEKDELKKALKMAEQVVELMEDKEHCGKAAVGEEDLRTKPVVIAVPAELAAQLVWRYAGDVEKVKKYTNRLMNALKQYDFLEKDLQTLDTLIAQRDFKTKHEQAAAVTTLALELFNVIPVWNALKTAREVLGGEMPMSEEARQLEQTIRQTLQKGEDALEKLRFRDGKEIASEDGYGGYVADAVARCELAVGEEMEVE